MTVLHSHRFQAFTLIELLGVLSILAILLSLAIPVLQKTMAQAKMSRARADIAKIESALNLFRMDTGAGPTAADAGLIMEEGGLFSILSADPDKPLTSPSTSEAYLQVPANQTIAATRQFVDPWKTPYWIRRNAVNNPNNFDVFSAGPDKTPGNADDINNWDR